MEECELAARLADNLLHALEPTFEVFDVPVPLWSVTLDAADLKRNDEDAKV